MKNTPKRGGQNKGQKPGSKDIFKPEHIQIVKLRLAQEKRFRDWLIFSLGINGRLREGDLTGLKRLDVEDETGIKKHTQIIQEKTGKVQKFTIPEDARKHLKHWIESNDLQPWNFLFPSPKRLGHPLSTRHLRNLVKDFASLAGLPRDKYSSHSLRRSGADYLYRRTGNLKVVQVALCHASIQTTAIYLGVDDTEMIELSEANPL